MIYLYGQWILKLTRQEAASRVRLAFGLAK